MEKYLIKAPGDITLYYTVGVKDKPTPKCNHYELRAFQLRKDLKEIVADINTRGFAPLFVTVHHTGQLAFFSEL